MSGSVKVDVRESLREVDPEAWDAAALDGGFYSSHAWLGLFEGPSRIFAGLEADHVLLSRGQELVAVAACYTAKNPRSFSASVDPFREYVEEEGQPAPVPEESLYPAAICEPPLGFSNRLLVKPGLAPEERDALGARLVDEVRAVAKKRGARLVTFGHLPAEDAIVVARGPHVTPAFALAEAWLRIDGGMDAHLERIGSHARRGAKSEMRKFERAGLTLRTARFSEVVSEFVPLFLQQQRKFGNEMEADRIRPIFDKMIAGADDRTRVFCAMRESRLVGATVFFLHRGIYHARLWAADQAEDPEGASMYFNCLYYEPIRSAERDGAREIHMGLDAIEAKVRHGCRLRALWTVFAFAEPPAPALVDRLRARSARRWQEQRDVLRRNGKDEAWIDEALQGAHAKTLAGS